MLYIVGLLPQLKHIFKIACIDHYCMLGDLTENMMFVSLQVYVMQRQELDGPELSGFHTSGSWLSFKEQTCFLPWFLNRESNGRISKIEKGGDHPTQYLNFKDKDMQAREWFDFINIEPL